MGKPIIIAGRFHFCRYIYCGLDRVRIRVQQTFHDCDRMKCKRMKHVFHEAKGELKKESYGI
ncbi:transposase [Radiobacillus deserti]|uniref:Transposase n=1 Tax=Radiobacillus deserti TaxID=2594883 RepID=A0A516KLH0_9BACI|nr:transposase [Radiobacillus deserti]